MMKRRLFLTSLGAAFTGGALFGSAALWLWKDKVPTHALVTDPEMKDFAYSDGWIIPLEK